MEILGALGGGAFVLASLVVGIRLMRLALRTGGLAEWVLGGGLFLMGGVSYPLTLAALLGSGLPFPLRLAFVWCHMLFNVVGMTMLAIFTLRVFRPGQTWARLLVAGITGAYVTAMLVQALGPGTEGFIAAQGRGPWRESQYAAITALFWAGFESLRYHRMMRRRMALGLADPVVTDRFRLWAISMGAAGSITTIGLVLEAFGYNMIHSAGGALLIGTLGLVITVALWLAFFPPRAYLRRVAARAAGG